MRASALLLFVALATGSSGCGSAEAAQPSPVFAPGRFQIVNPTPQYLRNVMLIDTVTGESWVSCTSKDDQAGWCALPRWSSGSFLEPLQPKVER